MPCLGVGVWPLLQFVLLTPLIFWLSSQCALLRRARAIQLESTAATTRAARPTTGHRCPAPIRNSNRWRSRHSQVSLDTKNAATGGDFREILPAHGPSPREALRGEERAQMVCRAVEVLPEELRVPLSISEYEDLSRAEVGTVLNYFPKAIGTRRYRARPLLQDQLTALLVR